MGETFYYYFFFSLSQLCWDYIISLSSILLMEKRVGGRYDFIDITLFHNMFTGYVMHFLWNIDFRVSYPFFGESFWLLFLSPHILQNQTRNFMNTWDRSWREWIFSFNEVTCKSHLSYGNLLDQLFLKWIITHLCSKKQTNKKNIRFTV